MSFMWMKLVLLNLFGYWNINELIVFGSENIALLKPTRQSSEYLESFFSYNVVDGDLSTNQTKCSHTDLPTDTPNWLVIDLKAQYEVTSIAVLNRDCDCADRLRNFTVSVWKYDPGPHIKYNMVDTEYCVCINYRSTAPRAILTNLTCTKICLGRFVLLVLNNPDYLSICELEVYGNISNGCSTQYLHGTNVTKMEGKRSIASSCPLLPYQVSNVHECIHRCLQINNCTSFNYRSPVINNVNCQLVRCFLHPNQDLTVDNAWNWHYF